MGKGAWFATKNTFKAAVCIAKFTKKNFGKQINLNDIWDDIGV